MVRLAPGVAEIVDHVRSGRRLKDGELLIDVAEPTIGERRKLSFMGMVSVAVAIDAKGDVKADPEIALMGLPSRTRDEADMVELVGDVVDRTIEGLPRQRRRNPEVLEKAIERAVRGAVAQAWGKKPVCHVLVLEV